MKGLGKGEELKLEEQVNPFPANQKLSQITTTKCVCVLGWGWGMGIKRIIRIIERKVCIIFYTVIETLSHISAHLTLKIVKTDIFSLLVMFQRGE